MPFLFDASAYMRVLLDAGFARAAEPALRRLAPLPQFIEHLYLERFGRERPEVVMSVEERARAQEAERAGRKEAKRRARAEGHGAPPGEA